MSFHPSTGAQPLPRKWPKLACWRMDGHKEECGVPSFQPSTASSAPEASHQAQVAYMGTQPTSHQTAQLGSEQTTNCRIMI